MSNLVDLIENALKKDNEFTHTANGALARTSTGYKVYDFFAFAGAQRSTPSLALKEFVEAYQDSPRYAVKALFWLRDCKEGAGERDLFRTCFTWLMTNAQELALRLIPLIPTYGRWDDLFVILDAYSLCVGNTTFEKSVYKNLIYKQLVADMESDHPSLCAKWMPSINTSSPATRNRAQRVRKFLGLSNKEYRKMLTILRKKIKVVETQMSANNWDAIDFSMVPSQANIKYASCFRTREETASRYADFINSKESKIHAATLYPYQLAYQAVNYAANDATTNKLWAALPDYCNDSDKNILCVADTSGSMLGCEASAPIYSSIALATYCAERNQGLFHNCYITFSEEPQVVKLDSKRTIAEQLRWIYRHTINANTDLNAVFDLILKIAIQNNLSKSEMPESIVVISDMQIDEATNSWRWRSTHKRWTSNTAATEMEQMRELWRANGYELPHLIYWNVNAAKPVILDKGPDVTFVSGLAPTHFKAICSGLTGIKLMYETLDAERYDAIEDIINKYF